MKATTRDMSRWGNYVPIVILALIGVMVTWHLFREVNSLERQSVHNAFTAAASDRILVVQREIDYALGVVQDIGSFIDASPRTGRREFRNFVGPALKRYGSIEALQWVPRVTEEERETFEKRARRSFPRYRINERGPDGNLIPAAPRELHFPVLYVQPYQLNKDVLGLDLASDPGALEVLLQVRDTGRMQVSPRIRLRGEGVGTSGFVARLPVYHKLRSGDEEDRPVDTVEMRRLLLRGFAVGVFRVGAIVERALANLSPSGIDLVLYDVSEGGSQYLYRHASRMRARSAVSEGPPAGQTPRSLEVRDTVGVSDRQWEIVCTPVPGYFQPDLRSGWVVLASGWSFTALLAVYLSTLVGSNARVKRLVAERTAQLVSVNDALNREIGERLSAEKELQELNETLEQRVAERTAESERHARELEQFAYVASHDLKAPLRGISNLAGWLREDLEGRLGDETREQLDLLRDRVQRMNALIEGLLTYSRIGRTESSSETVDVAALLEEVVDSLAPPPGFEVDVADEMPTLHTDRLQLSQVFSNLIGNSIKHRKGDQGHVWVTVKRRGRFHEFTVRDDGPGIAPEYHDKVFKIFQVLEPKDYGSDTGIGLALVRKIVQEYGGAIHLESGIGKGAAFRFTWPAGDA